MVPVKPGLSDGGSATGAAPIVAWWDPPADGATNMALDEALASEAIRLDRVLVRISTWSEPTLSLGAFQAIGEARALAALEGLPMVRRPSGGGAILHGSDVTLSVAVPRAHPCGGSPQRLYDTVHAALVAELAARGIAAGLSAGESTGTRPGAGAPAAVGLPGDRALLCFDRRATGDVVMPAADGRGNADAKVLGSAQRRLRGAVLQHGSLLLAANRLVPESVRHPGLDDLQAGGGACAGWGPGGACAGWGPGGACAGWGPGGACAGWGPGGIDLVRGWLTRLAAAFGVGLEEPSGSFAPSPSAGVEEGMVRFRQDSWNARR